MAPSIYFHITLILPILSFICPPTSAETFTKAPNPISLLRRQGSDPGSTSCDGFNSMEASCTVATPDFLNLPFTVEASCLCYAGAVWQPSVFDNYADTCLSHLQTASPSLFTYVGTAFPTAACKLAGDVRASTHSRDSNPASATITSPPSTASSTDPNFAACVSWDAIENSCAAAIRSFSALAFSIEASCVCYSSATYAPGIFDGLFGSCLNYYKTASPAFYTSSIGGDSAIRTPCALAGNVISGAPTPAGLGKTSSGSSLIMSSASTLVSSESASLTSGGTPTPASTILTTTVPTGSAGESRVADGFLSLVVGLVVLLLVH